MPRRNSTLPPSSTFQSTNWALRTRCPAISILSMGTIRVSISCGTGTNWKGFKVSSYTLCWQAAGWNQTQHIAADLVTRLSESKATVLYIQSFRPFMYNCLNHFPFYTDMKRFKQWHIFHSTHVKEKQYVDISTISESYSNAFELLCWD